MYAFLRGLSGKTPSDWAFFFLAISQLAAAATRPPRALVYHAYRCCHSSRRLLSMVFSPFPPIRILIVFCFPAFFCTAAAAAARIAYVRTYKQHRCCVSQLAKRSGGSGGSGSGGGGGGGGGRGRNGGRGSAGSAPAHGSIPAMTDRGMSMSSGGGGGGEEGKGRKQKVDRERERDRSGGVGTGGGGGGGGGGGVSGDAAVAVRTGPPVKKSRKGSVGWRGETGRQTEIYR